MKLLKFVFFFVVVLGFSLAFAQNELPTFSEYPVVDEEIFKEKPASVDLSSYKGAKTFRTKLQEGARLGPNFAGHFTIVTIGCGTQCQENWLIDAKTGKILNKFHSDVGVAFQLNSFLLVINPPDPDLKKGYENYPDQPLLGTLDTTYQVWKDNKFDVTHKDKWVNVIKTLP